MKKVAVYFAALALIIFLSNSSVLIAKGKKEKTTFKAELASKELSSYGKSKAKGHAWFQFSKDGKSLSYKLYVYGIDSVSMAHIHHGPFGKEGPIAAWLYKGKITGKFNGLLAKGTITSKDVNMDDLRKWMTSGDTYVLVHTQRFPNGEIGGKIN